MNKERCVELLVNRMKVMKDLSFEGNYIFLGWAGYPVSAEEAKEIHVEALAKYNGGK